MDEEIRAAVRRVVEEVDTAYDLSAVEYEDLMDALMVTVEEATTDRQ